MPEGSDMALSSLLLVARRAVSRLVLSLLWLLLLNLLLPLPSCYSKEKDAECGKPYQEGKVIGGEDAKRGKWPWQVSLFFRGAHVCGATILNKHWLLTAAHCFDQTLNLLEYFDVYVGITDLTMKKNFKRHEIRHVIIHPHYKLTHPNGNDIALVLLKKTLKFSSHVLPICLPHSNIDIQKLNSCWITGWGKMKESGEIAEKLQEVKLPIMDQFFCKIFYGGSFSIQEDMLCAADMINMKGACLGDSGGPLVCKLNETWIQIGVVTWGRGCTTPLFPGVFARVPFFIPWISMTLKAVIVSRAATIVISWIILTTPLLFIHILRIQ